jgi:peptidyl-prolyl cis-trans isomerase B (cyclophilin B)
MSRSRGALIAALLIASVADSVAAQGTAASKPTTPAAPAAAPAQRTPGAGPVVVIETDKGTIQFETYPAEAPKTVEQVLALVKRNFYNGLRVHRVVPGFVVQFGDPQTRDVSKRAAWGTMGSGKVVGVAEIKRSHSLGAVAMAHAGDAAKADSQMYITLAPQPRLDSGYTVFGQVIAGMDVVNRLAVGDVIRRATVRP